MAYFVDISAGTDTINQLSYIVKRLPVLVGTYESTSVFLKTDLSIISVLAYPFLLDIA